jgi:hypothetical protein
MKKITVLSLAILTFAIFSNAQMMSKKDDSSIKVDPLAYDLLKDARSTSQNFPTNFGGYSADVIYNDNGKIYTGTIDYTPKVAMKIEIKGLEMPESKKLEGEITSLISHRRAGDFSKSDGKYPITFGADDQNPIGRMVCLNDELKSCYRVKNKQVVQVNRTMGGEFFTINILETTPTPEGKYLPRQFSVTYFDEKTKAMKRTQFFSDTFENMNGVFMPKSRRIITCESGETKVRIMEFANFKARTELAKMAK